METELEKVLERILSPREMKRRFGRPYDVKRSKKDGLVYMTSDFFVRELRNNPGNKEDPNNVVEDIVPTYFSIVRSFENYESRKRHGRRY